jgi:hypothetical protein
MSPFPGPRLITTSRKECLSALFYIERTHCSTAP